MMITKENTHRVSFNDLPDFAPLPTPTWQPQPHRRIAEMVKNNLLSYGWDIKEEEYAIMVSGRRPTLQDFAKGVLFAHLKLLNESFSEEVTPCLIFRHGNNRDVALRIAGGFAVTICDNMAFSGNKQSYSKHLTGQDFPSFIQNSVQCIIEQVVKIPEKIERMKSQELSRLESDSLMWKAAACGVMPLNLLLSVDGRRDKEESSLWGLHNAFTYVATRLRVDRGFEYGENVASFFGM